MTSSQKYLIYKTQYGLKSINSVGFNEISVKINCFGTKIEIYKEYKI